jgi:hypothetical protein
MMFIVNRASCSGGCFGIKAGEKKEPGHQRGGGVLMRPSSFYIKAIIMPIVLYLKTGLVGGFYFSNQSLVDLFV